MLSTILAVLMEFYVLIDWFRSLLFTPGFQTTFRSWFVNLLMSFGSLKKIKDWSLFAFAWLVWSCSFQWWISRGIFYWRTRASEWFMETSVLPRFTFTLALSLASCRSIRTRKPSSERFRWFSGLLLWFPWLSMCLSCWAPTIVEKVSWSHWELLFIVRGS